MFHWFICFDPMTTQLFTGENQQTWDRGVASTGTPEQVKEGHIHLHYELYLHKESLKNAERTIPF